MPPPAEASTRIAAICSCSFCCMACACFIMFCMLPGIFILVNYPFLLIQISHGTHLGTGKQFLKTLDAWMRKRSLTQFIFGRRGLFSRGNGRDIDIVASFYTHAYSPTGHL